MRVVRQRMLGDSSHRLRRVHEVRAVMGPPDSILFGWWIYGGSQVLFGYGTVQSYENAGNLILC